MKKAKSNKVENRGGVRSGAGRPKSGKITTTKAFRINVDIEQEFTRRVKELIKELDPTI
tara:strand:+ start:543 stop:719 length:177 start_codon:yes stop_codon:yes gene_type:complete